MKKTITTLLLLSCITAFSFAQSIVMTSGTIDFIKDQQVIQFTFSYDEMLVGKLTESEYVDKKSSEYNAKEEGKGDQWKAAWYGDRKERFEPKFLELFDKYMSEVGITAGTEALNIESKSIQTSPSRVGMWVSCVRMHLST